MKTKRTKIPRKRREELLFRAGYRCAYCGAEEGSVALEIDHVIPLVQGGTNDVTNLQVLCRPCNHAKSDSIPEGL